MHISYFNILTYKLNIQYMCMWINLRFVLFLLKLSLFINFYFKKMLVIRLIDGKCSACGSIDYDGSEKWFYRVH